MVKNPLVHAGGPSLIPGLGRSPGEGHGNPLQYSCLGNPMHRGAWWATYSPWGPKRVRHNLATKKKQHLPTDLPCPRQPGHTLSHRLGSPSQSLTCSYLSPASPNTSFLPFKSPFSSAVKSQFKHNFFFQENFLVTTRETSDQCQSPTSKSIYSTAAC